MPEAPKRTQVNVKLDVPGGPDARVLLHACCAPCSGAIVETMVAQGIRPTIFWSNSNIYDKEEYDKRKAEILRYAAEFGLEVVDDDYDHSDWLAGAAAGREDAPERGARCLECFKYRLLRAARYAAGHGFDVLTTTLASSRWKSLGQVDAAGAWACAAAAANGGLFPPSDFSGRGEQSEHLPGHADDPGEGLPGHADDPGEGLPSRRPGYIRGGTPDDAGEGLPSRRPGYIRGGTPDDAGEGLPGHADDPGEGLPSRRPGYIRGGTPDDAGEGLPGHAVAWWPMNWRKGGLQPRRAEIIREQNFYNQTFCGCEFSHICPSRKGNQESRKAIPQ